MSTYKGTLAEYVMARRGLLGWSLTETAARAGLSKSELSAIETGKVKLPGADKRRRLAAVLGGFHAEFLVGAGEITPEEIIEGANVYDPKRAEAVSPFPVGTAAARVVELMKGMTDEEVGFVLGTAEFVVSHRVPGASRGHGPNRRAG